MTRNRAKRDQGEDRPARTVQRTGVIGLTVLTLLWHGRINGQCGGDHEERIIPGIITLVLNEEAAKLVDRENIGNGGLLMGLLSLDSLNASVGVASITLIRTQRVSGTAFRVYNLYFDALTTVEQTCSLLPLYQNDPNVEIAQVNGRFGFTAIPWHSWARVKALPHKEE